jgi:hypothetical protein
MGLDHCLHHSCVSFRYNTTNSHNTAPMLTFILSIIGGALMSFLPTTNRSGILAGIYLVNAVVAPLTVFYGVSPTAFLP